MNYDDGDLEMAAGEVGFMGSGGDKYGPITMISMTGWTTAFGKRCGTASFVPILTGLVLVADAILAIFAGLDAIDRGTSSPWLEFAYSLVLSTCYASMFVICLIMYRWERVLRYRYHWLLTLFIATTLSWINFGLWGSWQTRFSQYVGGISASDGNAFTSWIAINAVGVVGFMIRFTVLMIGQGFKYTFDRTIEIDALVLEQTSGGKKIFDVLNSGKRYATVAQVSNTVPSPKHSNISGFVSSPYALLQAQTYWGANLQKKEQVRNRQMKKHKKRHRTVSSNPYSYKH